MIFTKLNIFDNFKVNQLCDNLYTWVGVENLLICGGVARCLYGENHTPKDLDIVTKTEKVFNYIHKHIDHKFVADAFVRKITKSEKRIVIYTDIIAVEIWNGKTIHAQSNHRYKGLLPFVLSSRMKKTNQDAY